MNVVWEWDAVEKYNKKREMVRLRCEMQLKKPLNMIDVEMHLKNINADW